MKTPSQAKTQGAGASAGLAGKKLPGSAGQTSESLTAKMLDYRSWWNLPRPKARKSPLA